MHTGPNEPCPCGSGRKYKKCCGDPREQRPVASAAISATAPADKGSSPLCWEPLPEDRIPAAPLEEAEEKRLLSQSQRAYLAAIVGLLRSSKRTEWEKALKLLDAIPYEQQCRLQSVMVVRNAALSNLGRSAQSADLLTSFLCSTSHPALWWEHGLALGELAATGVLDDSLRVQLGNRIAEAATRDHLVPQQILALRFLAMRKDPEERLVQMAVEALDIASWKDAGRLRKLWLRRLIGPFFIAMAGLCSRGRTDEARQHGRAAAAFDWESAGDLSDAERRLLCLSFWFAEQTEQTRRIADHWRRGDESAAEAFYWLARCEAVHGRNAKAAQHARKAWRGRGLDPSHRLGVAECLVADEDFATALKVLERIGPSDDARWWGFRALCLEQRHPEEALTSFARVMELAPSDSWAALRSAAILATQRRLPEAIELLDRVANDPEADFALTARVIAASLRPSCEEQARDLEYFLQPEHRWDQVLDEQAQSFFAVTYARTLLECGRFSEAVDWARIAVELEREESTHAVLISALIKDHLLDEAERELAAACKSWPRSEGLWSSRVQLDLLRERWRNVLQQLEGKGFDRFAKCVGLKTAAITRAMAQEGVGDALGVLETCSAHAELAACEELAELRADALRAVREQRDTLQQQVRAQALIVADAEASRRAAERQKRRAHELETELSRVIDQRRTTMPLGMMQRPVGEAEIRTAIERDHATLLARLTPANRGHLLSAGRLWEKLSDDPGEDHGPVVLQLARALEGEVNRLLVDPFVAHASSRRVPLHRLQTTTDGTLRPNANRLSLGEAAALLHARLEQRNADGSTTVLRNARSDTEHAALIESFWAERDELTNADKEYLKNDFLLALQSVARLRNQAGHAGDAIKREHAGRVMTMLLGDGTAKGALERLLGMRVTAE